MYSQNSEEKIILDYFGDSKGKLLDIGANDGRILSNSLALIERGWGAVLVEPDLNAFYKLKELHRLNEDVYCFNIAITDKTDTVDFYQSGTHLKQGDTGLVSTVSESDYNKWKSSTEYTITKTETSTFADFLTLFKTNQYKFITIDAEGMDLVILKQMNLTELGCHLLCVEYNGQNKKEFDNHVTTFGLTLIHQNGENLIYGR